MGRSRPELPWQAFSHLRRDLTIRHLVDRLNTDDTGTESLRATKPPQDFDDFSYGTIVAATFECIMANAAQSPATKFVSLRVDGAGISKRYDGVFRTAGYRRGPTKRDFKDTGMQRALQHATTKSSRPAVVSPASPAGVVWRIGSC